MVKANVHNVILNMSDGVAFRRGLPEAVLHDGREANHRVRHRCCQILLVL